MKSDILFYKFQRLIVEFCLGGCLRESALESAPPFASLPAQRSWFKQYD